MVAISLSAIERSAPAMPARPRPQFSPRWQVTSSFGFSAGARRARRGIPASASMPLLPVT
jgi:hypothetical protein